ncbi:RHS repeat domain-containing protein [Frigidibacter sp. SD6-1]|uniref:RHS repeat domain-containing protein n=1 Tax=Frigidibacter sp. SD6-1 TaxID=3032581 RepID=UPI0024DF3E68|nr:RHS repeat domain-containing protein [Frigidibacter sp. SD6-1]
MEEKSRGRSAAFSPTGQPARITLPDGTEWQFTYDAEGRILTTRYGNAGTTPPASTYTYDVIGQLLTYTNTRGKTWTFTYDAARRLTKTVNPSGDTASYSYDLMGNLTRTEYSDGAAPATFWAETEFDALGRVLRQLGANGQVWANTHDVEDNLTSVTDAMNFTASTAYDALNRAITETDEESYQTGMAYDEADRMTLYTDPRSLSTSFTYNGFGDVIGETSPDRGTIAMSYDSRGLVASRTDARGITALYTYDNGGRIKKIDYSGGAAEDLWFFYNAQGKLSKIKDSYVDLSMSDIVSTSVGYITGRNFTLAPGRSYYVQEQANYDGDPLRIRYPAPSSDFIHYTLDDDGRVIRVSWQPGGTGPLTTLVDNITYLPNGPLAVMKFADGSIEERIYDESYRLIALTDSQRPAILRDLELSYDTRDNLTGIADLLAPSNNESFAYTPREALSSASGPYGAYGFLYDGVGNRVEQSTPSGVESYAYPSTSNRLTTVSAGAGAPRAFTYDAAGNVITDQRGGLAYGYGYNAAGRLSAVSLGGVVQGSYRYDALGRQVSRTLASGQVIHSVFDSAGHRLAEYDGATGALIRSYVWLGDLPVAVIEGGQVYLVRVDHIGRPVFATTMAGTVVWRASYLPFGGVHVTTGAPIDLRFPGQWFQMESGLHQNWMRDYDPTTGRYIQADPLGLVDGASVYGYARQNPGRWIDPRGECPWCVGMLIGAGLGAISGYMLDQAIGDGCYTWEELAVDATLGAIFAGGGFWATGVRRAGTEFSHAVPSRIMNNGSDFMRWLNGRSNPYRALNGNYVTPGFHAATDYYRRIRNVPADQMYDVVTRTILRTPGWIGGGLLGGVAGEVVGP